MNLFYTPPENIQLPDIYISGQEAVHISKVLRHAAGDSLHVTDGEGRKFSGTINQISKNNVKLKSEKVVTEEREKPYVVLCIGLIKKRDRLEFAIEKATEVGADEIVIFRGEHSQKQNVRFDRLQSTALSAMKQSLRLYLPKIGMVSSLKMLVEQKKEERQTLIVADEMSGENPNSSDEKIDKNILLIVGPEGGFSDNERALLKNYSAIPYSLGNKRLRTETAAILMADRFKNRV